ncbi:MAG: thioredoxin domain-containing protein [bacterium]|nr:thioredoxin domain-containing protein [bacterium]
MNKDNLVLSVSILLTGILISGAVIYSTTNRGNLAANVGNLNIPSGNGAPVDIKVNPVTAADHIRGNINAPIKLIEFSDFECPFCGRFHPTMQQIVKEYGDKVVWVYRHFPLESIHPDAKKGAIGSECANELGGSTAFWAYTDKIFADQQGSLADLGKVATSIGLNVTAFNTCLKSTKYDEVISKDITDATNSGGQGTPWTVIVNSKGKTFSINGAQPYEQVKATIEQALK